MSLLPGSAPAIGYLCINPYQWRTECLSGDVNAGPATSFPQALGLVIKSYMYMHAPGSWTFNLPAGGHI